MYLRSFSFIKQHGEYIKTNSEGAKNMTEDNAQCKFAENIKMIPVADHNAANSSTHFM